MSESVNIDDLNGGTALSEVLGYDSFKLHLGDQMRGERATLGKSLLDVQRDLRIRASYIAAIENCDVTAFHTPGFIAGYVRSYARYLGLNPENAFLQFCEEAGFDGVHLGLKGQKSKPSAAQPNMKVALASHGFDPLANPRAQSSVVRDGFFTQISASGLGSIFVLLVLIFGLGYGAWTVLQDIQRVEINPLEDDSALIAELPSATAREAALDQLYRPKELEVPVMTPRDGPIAALDPDNIGALVENNGGIRAQETAELMAAESPRVTELAAPLVAVVATRAAWVRVSLSDGTILFEKILDAGESIQLPSNSTSTTLRAGNSGSVYLSLDGKAYGPIGGDTSVVKNVALAPEAILENYLAVNDAEALKTLDNPRVITLNDN
jgi:cytoskeleton protein RodZ